MVSESSAVGQHDDGIQRLEDHLRITGIDPNELWTISQEMMANMTRSQGQGERKKSGGAEESATVKERPEEASPASRAGSSREFDVRRDYESKVKIGHKLHHRRWPREANTSACPG